MYSQHRKAVELSTAAACYCMQALTSSQGPLTWCKTALCQSSVQPKKHPPMAPKIPNPAIFLWVISTKLKCNKFLCPLQNIPLICLQKKMKPKFQIHVSASKFWKKYLNLLPHCYRLCQLQPAEGVDGSGSDETVCQDVYHCCCSALKCFFLRCLSSGGLEFDIIDFKHRIRRFGSNLTEKRNGLFASPFIYVTEGRILVALTLWSHCSGPLRSPLRFLGALCAALWWLEINWISDLPRGRKKAQFVAVCKIHSGKSSVDEETLTSSYQQTEQRSFDPSPEPPLNRLAALCDDGEWDAVVGPQIAALRLFSCHFLRTVWINTLSLLYPVCGNIWQAGAPDLIC